MEREGRVGKIDKIFLVEPLSEVERFVRETSKRSMWDVGNDDLGSG